MDTFISNFKYTNSSFYLKIHRFTVLTKITKITGTFLLTSLISDKPSSSEMFAKCPEFCSKTGRISSRIFSICFSPSKLCPGVSVIVKHWVSVMPLTDEKQTPKLLTRYFEQKAF